MSIYNMKLHDTYNEPDSNIHITRVPGGWIYNYVMRNYTVFIPYHDEFDEELKAARATAAKQMERSYQAMSFAQNAHCQ